MSDINDIKIESELLRDPDVISTSKRPLMVLTGAVCSLLASFAGILSFSVFNDEKLLNNSTIEVERPEKKAFATGNDAGLIPEFFTPEEQKKNEMQTSGVIAARSEPADEVRVVTVHMPAKAGSGRSGRNGTNDTVSPKEQEADDFRRMRLAALQKAVNSGLGTSVKPVALNTTASPASTTGQGRLDVEALTAHLRTAAATAAATKTTTNGITAVSDNWELPNKRRAGAKYELKTGTVIPGILVTSINSDLAGAVTAQVSQDVYDSTTGLHVLVPSGSKLYGTYASSVAFGQESLFVVWQRIIYPDGSSLTLGDEGMGGSRPSGQSGFSDRVDNHYFKIFSSAILMSMISATASYVLDDNSSSSSNGGSNINQSATNALAQQLGQSSLALLQRNLNISPTLEIRAGYQFLISATKDITFDAPYYNMARR